MTGFNHTLAGAAVALAVREPILIAPLAFFSHFVMDVFPHFGRHPEFIPYTETFKKYLVADALLCVVMLGLAIGLASEHWFILAWGAAWATLPDFIWIARPYAPRRLKWFFDFHEKIQWGERPYGWIFEIVYTGILLSILLKLN